MKELWYGCPNCYLAFSKDTEYKRHFEVDHPKKKFRLAGKIDSAANYWELGDIFYNNAQPTRRRKADL